MIQDKRNPFELAIQQFCEIIQYQEMLDLSFKKNLNYAGKLLQKIQNFDVHQKYISMHKIHTSLLIMHSGCSQTNQNILQPIIKQIAAKLLKLPHQKIQQIYNDQPSNRKTHILKKVRANKKNYYETRKNQQKESDLIKQSNINNQCISLTQGLKQQEREGCFFCIKTYQVGKKLKRDIQQDIKVVFYSKYSLCSILKQFLREIDKSILILNGSDKNMAQPIPQKQDIKRKYSKIIQNQQELQNKFLINQIKLTNQGSILAITKNFIPYIPIDCIVYKKYNQCCGQQLITLLKQQEFDFNQNFNNDGMHTEELPAQQTLQPLNIAVMIFRKVQKEKILAFLKIKLRNARIYHQKFNEFLPIQLAAIIVSYTGNNILYLSQQLSRNQWNVTRKLKITLNIRSIITQFTRTFEQLYQYNPKLQAQTNKFEFQIIEHAIFAGIFLYGATRQVAFKYVKQ